MDVKLKPVRRDDFPLLLAWAHISEIWTYLPTSRSSEKLTWESHNQWWSVRKDRVDWMILVNFGHGKRPVGMVHVEGFNTEKPEIGLYIGEVALWGKGIGEQAIRLAIKATHLPSLWAVIHPKNINSIRLFHKVGFIKVGGARDEQDLYEYTIGGSEIAIPASKIGDRRSPQPIPI